MDAASSGTILGIFSSPAKDRMRRSMNILKMPKYCDPLDTRFVDSSWTSCQEILSSPFYFKLIPTKTPHTWPRTKEETYFQPLAGWPTISRETSKENAGFEIIATKKCASETSRESAKKYTILCLKVAWKKNNFLVRQTWLPLRTWGISIKYYSTVGTLFFAFH